MGNKSLDKAIEARKELGSKTDEIVLDILRKKPGLSTYELAKITGWSIGKVDGSLRRLARAGKLKIQYMSKEGRIIKEAYPTEVSLRRLGLVEIEREMLFAPEKWSKEVFVYGLNRLTIGISPYKVKDWDSRALMISRVPVHQNKHSISIELPQQFVDFYLLGNSRLSTSTVSDMALVTVEATIIPISVESVEESKLNELKKIEAPT
ncbi:MAG: winged helix-turn-helix domain-containing protein [archaeon]|nr:winged helix-turn-helix domain-containing protein [archaeon]MCP8316829.1 winged helix-turn-helix domain-containing protein [archaeon]MCP8319335.1 winged helix-turn-helix domain-containing protein [archaeon]